MQRFPTSPNEPRGPATRGSREMVAVPTTEEHRNQDELDATKDWLAHIAAGRITVR